MTDATALVAAPAHGRMRLALLAISLLVVEFALARLTYGLLESFPPDASAQANAVSAATSGAALFVRALVKCLSGFGVIWTLLFGMQLERALRDKGHLSAMLSRSKYWLPAHLAFLAAIIVTNARLKGFSIPFLSMGEAGLLLLYLVTFCGFALTLLRLFAPFGFWAAYAREQRVLLGTSGLIALVVAALESVGPSLTNPGAHHFTLLLRASAAIATPALELFGYQVQSDSARMLMSVDRFTVYIGPECLGYQGVSIALVFMSGYLYLNRSTLRFPNALLIFPMLLLALFVGNALRIAALLAIGASWSVKVAVFGFHSAAGWVNLLVILSMALFALHRVRFFARHKQRFSFELAADRVRILPMLAWIALTLLSLLASPGFEWLYPVRVVLVAGLLMTTWRQLRLERIERYRLPVAVGCAVFLLWWAMVPADATESRRFAEHLDSVPAWAMLTWVCFRVVGAVVMIPIAEELAFRGYLLPALQDRLGVWMPSLAAPVRVAIALVLTSVGFGLLHSAWVAGSIAGLAYGALSLSSRRVTDAVLAHSVTNLMLAVYVLMTGNWSYW